jgi:Helicase associated domain
LSDERETLLNEVGFVWDSHQASWNDHCQQLEAFFHAFGHFQIPSSADNAEYASLSIWCKHQRRQYRNFVQGTGNTTITYDRIQKLEAIGFEWDPRNLAGAGGATSTAASRLF